MRILIIEDDTEMREFLKIALERESFIIDSASDGREGSYKARTNEYDLIILDNMLPYKHGAEVCREIRRSGKTTPILLLSIKSTADDKAELLDAGVDDYMTKPYSHKELLARIRALTRRPLSIKENKLQIHDLILDCSTFEVWKNGKEIYLTSKEFALLELLVENKGKVVSRGAILEHIWDANGDILSKTVETHILNLRKKIEKDQKIITTVIGRGYKIEAKI